MSDKNIVNKVISGFAWEGSVKVIVQALSWISTIYVARILNPEDYGIVAISGIFHWFLPANWWDGVECRYYSEARDNQAAERWNLLAKPVI